MKRKDGFLTDDEYIIFMCIFELRKAKMNEKETKKLNEKTEYLKKLLDENYEYL